jgi:GT2 family glycosyltransferase
MATTLASAPLQASIITVNYNGLAHLKKFLPALFESRGNFELILADNGSRDGSLDFVASKFPDTRILSIGQNVGYGLANNKAAQMARSDMLVFLNPDTQVHPDWLPHLLEPFDNPAVGLTTAKILLANAPERINTCGNLVHISGLVTCRGMGEARDRFSKPDEVAAVSGAAFAIRRDLFNALGGFDEEFFMYIEDTDLSLRARLAGWHCGYAPDSVVWHDYALRLDPVKIQYLERNRYRMLLKNLRWPTLIVLSPVFLLAEIVTWGFALQGDRDSLRNKYQAYRETILHLREILQRRKEVQRLRATRDRDLLRLLGSNLDFLQATQSVTARWAAVVFNPLFFLLRTAVLLLVWW